MLSDVSEHKVIPENITSIFEELKKIRSLNHQPNMKRTPAKCQAIGSSHGGFDKDENNSGSSYHPEGSKHAELGEIEDISTELGPEIFQEIKNAIESVRNDPLGHLSPMYYLILDLRPPSMGSFQFRAVQYLSESHMRVIGKRSQAAQSSRFDTSRPVQKLLNVLGKLSSRQLAELSSYMRIEGATGLLLRLQEMKDPFPQCRQNTLEELLKEEWSGLQKNNREDLSNSQIVVDLEGVNATAEEIQWIFHVLDQCRRVISSDVLSTNLTERDVDINLVKTFFDTLWDGLHLHFGEGESRASRNRRGRCGDHFDWLFSCNSILPDDVRGVELGVAENSGPSQVHDMEKARTDFVKAVKTARDQLIQAIKIVKNKYNSEQLPSNFVEGIKALFAVAINIVGYEVQAHTVYYLGGNVFATSEIGRARLPKSLDRMHDALDMIRLVLRVKALLLRSKQILQALLAEAMIERSATPMPAQLDAWTVTELDTPKKSRKPNKSRIQWKSQRKHMGLVNAMKRGTTESDWTWENSRGTQKIIDHVFLTEKLGSVVTDLIVQRTDEYFNTDHRSVSMSVGIGTILDIEIRIVRKPTGRNGNTMSGMQMRKLGPNLREQYIRVHRIPEDVCEGNLGSVEEIEIAKGKVEEKIRQAVKNRMGHFRNNKGTHNQKCVRETFPEGNSGPFHPRRNSTIDPK
ncbi:hypothetical protein G9A89_004420 [Geosiphon pyriformis]|nr:hypothetical protein G9A89_004420 [Geosiphon pyriformis]